MCVVSMVGDHYNDKWKDIFPDSWKTTPFLEPAISREEFNQLKRDVEEMKVLLARAIKYDKDNNQAGCEIAEKIEFLKKVAQLVGVDLEKALKDNGSKE